MLSSRFDRAAFKVEKLLHTAIHFGYQLDIFGINYLQIYKAWDGGRISVLRPNRFSQKNGSDCENGRLRSADRAY